MPDGYTIRKVDGTDPDIARRILNMHVEVFGFSAPLTAPWKDHWWIAWIDNAHAAFASLVTHKPGVGYLSRCGVLPEDRGNGLQRKLIRARERFARKLGLKRLVTDTTDNPESAKNLLWCGYREFEPTDPWAFRKSTYWEKFL